MYDIFVRDWESTLEPADMGVASGNMRFKAPEVRQARRHPKGGPGGEAPEANQRAVAPNQYVARPGVTGGGCWRERP